MLRHSSGGFSNYTTLMFITGEINYNSSLLITHIVFNSFSLFLSFMDHIKRTSSELVADILYMYVPAYTLSC